MELDPVLAALLVVLLGLIVAIAGYWLFKGVIGFMGALILGATGFAIGLWIGSFWGSNVGLIIAIVMGVVGAVIGAILAASLATVILAVGFGIVAFFAGVGIGERVGLSDAFALALGIVVAVVGSFLFLLLARYLVKAATSVLGGLLVASGSFYLLERYTSFDEGIAYFICIGIFIAVFLAGFFIQTDTSDGDGPGASRSPGRHKHVRRHHHNRR